MEAIQLIQSALANATDLLVRIQLIFSRGQVSVVKHGSLPQTQTNPLPVSGSNPRCGWLGSAPRLS